MVLKSGVNRSSNQISSKLRGFRVLVDGWIESGSSNRKYRVSATRRDGRQVDRFSLEKPQRILMCLDRVVLQIYQQLERDYPL